jgi:hypothetical protein
MKNDKKVKNKNKFLPNFICLLIMIIIIFLLFR